jgi:hypothetical protein
MPTEKKVIKMLEKVFKRQLRKWLEDRVLRLPEHQRKKIADTLHIDEEVVEAVEEAIRAEIIRYLGL